MSRKVNLILIIVNLVFIAIAINSYIGVQLSYKYGTLELILDNNITETERQQEFDAYISGQIEKGKRILLYIVVLTSTMTVLVLVRKKRSAIINSDILDENITIKKN